MKMELRLKKFDLSRIKDDKIVVLVGKRGTGKSALTKSIMAHHNDIPLGVVVSPTETANKFFSSFVPDVFIHDAYTPKLIANLVERQKKVSEQAAITPGSVDPRAFLVLDDCMYDTKWTKDENIRFSFMNGRHIKLFFIITQQYVLGLGPQLRTNVDFVFILRENIVSNRKRLFDNYAGMFPSFDVFQQVLEQCTNDYECMVIDNTVQSNKLTDQVYWYKADVNVPPFQMCSPHYWQLSKDIERRSNNKEPEVFDLDKFRKTSSHVIKVVKH
jgi:energy-coupling factor transporter ATP-binding protein EcfA2